MSYSSVINNLISEQLMNTHVAYVAKILSVTNNRAKIQPLGKYKQYGKDAKAYSPLENVPIADSAKYKLGTKTITYIKNKDLNSSSETIVTLKSISKGDIVLCICCDRNISSALKGENTTPPSGTTHDMSNSVIVAIL